MNLRIALIAAIAGFLLLAPEAGAAQGVADANALASQSLRGYTHMFIAYGIAWAVVVGWVISIARRLARVEEALREEA